MQLEQLKKNKKRYAELMPLITERQTEYISTVKTKEKKDNDDHMLAVSLFVLYERIVCHQPIDFYIADKPHIHNDDILLSYFNRYKPFFSGNQLYLFIPEQDMTNGTTAVPLLRIFNYLAYEIRANNPYAKTMIKQLFKVFEYTMYINMKDNVTSINFANLQNYAERYSDYKEKIQDQEDFSNALPDKVIEDMCLVWLFAYVSDITIVNEPEVLYDLFVNMVKEYHLNSIDGYHFKAPDYMNNAPSKEDFNYHITDLDNAFILYDYVVEKFDIDDSKASCGLPIYHRMKRFAKRFLYWNEFDVERDEIIPSEDFHTNMNNFIQAYYFLLWMFNYDETKITKELFEPAAAIIHILTGYIEHINHYVANVETLVRVEDSADAAKEYLESINNGTDPRINSLNAEIKKKDNEIKELQRQVEQLQRENNQLNAMYQAEFNKNEVLMKNAEDNLEWQQLEELYAIQVDKQKDIINELNKQVHDYMQEISVLQDEKSNLTFLNTELARERSFLEKEQNKESTLLVYGSDEKSFYQDEIRETVIEVLADYAKNYTPEDSRKAHILADILSTNVSRGIKKERRNRLKNAIKGDVLKNVAGTSLIKDLEELGFLMISDNSHIKVLFGGDPRYTITIPKTSSDNRAADNLYATIRNLCY